MRMANQGIVAYCIVAIVVTAIGLKFLKTRWVYLLVGSLLPPMLFIGGDALWRGTFSVWDDVVFVVLTFIALGIAVGLLLGRLVWLKLKPPQES
jgi:hypothetical protein